MIRLAPRVPHHVATIDGVVQCMRRVGVSGPRELSFSRNSAGQYLAGKLSTYKIQR